MIRIMKAFREKKENFPPQMQGSPLSEEQLNERIRILKVLREEKAPSTSK
jgi:hypothetical protein